MSASLVGSEMCIRDRLCGARRRESPPGLRPCRKAKASPNSRDGRSRAAVSYTHLTLPTICSV
eukprot:12427089-Alexandrium_andersonii.AAC.1